ASAELLTDRLSRAGLTRDRNIFVAAPVYIERAPRIAIPADLARHPLVGFAAFGKRQTFQLEGQNGARAEVEMTCRVTTTSGLAIKHWALAGAGIARFPRKHARALPPRERAPPDRACSGLLRSRGQRHTLNVAVQVGGNDRHRQWNSKS